MVARLPAASPSVLHPGDTVMIVASSGATASDAPTAITLLSGVDALLTAQSSGAAPMTLSPWNLGVPEGGGGPQ